MGDGWESGDDHGAESGAKPGTKPGADSVSVIIPALNEARTIASTLATLTSLRSRGGEVIVVDGGSTDATVERARPLADRVVSGPRGRARQMNAGAAVARGRLLWFLHADTRVDADATDRLVEAMRMTDREWGRCGVRLDSPRPLLRSVAALMNLRSRLSGIATGDQGLFVRRRAFVAIGGFPEQPLMEDIEICRRLLARSRPCCLPVALTTSARRWEQGGAWRTIALMWRLRWAYWWGADPARLARRYRGPAA